MFIISYHWAEGSATCLRIQPCKLLAAMQPLGLCEMQHPEPLIYLSDGDTVTSSPAPKIQAPPLLSLLSMQLFWNETWEFLGV